MPERRLAQRNKTYLGGRVAYAHRLCISDCIVRNMSADGAMLDFGHTAGLPAHFELTVQHRGESRCAKVIWRTETNVGVVLDAPERGVLVSLQATRRIRDLENERNRLALRISQLSETL